MAKVNTIEKTGYILELHQKFKNDLDMVNETIISHLKCEEKMIFEAAKYLISSGGKRIRPLLTIISAKLFGHNGNNANINLAAATEFIHAATLLHDDVVDSSLMRRFKPTVNSLWGNKEAILVGDFLFSQSFNLMVSSKSLSSLESLAKASAKIAMGEVRQLSKLKSNKIMTEEEYFEIISSKTAELFAASCKVGAIIANTSSENISSIYNFGKNIGLIFQMKDDLLDYFSSSEKIGKNIGDDFYESKVTLPIIYLNKLCNNYEREFINSLFTNSKKDTSEKNFKILLALLENYNIEEKVLDRLKQLKSEALEILESIIAPNDEMKDYLHKILLLASEREN